MTSSCFVIMACCRRTLADNTVNLKLALQSPRGLSVMRSASLCQQAPRMESDMAIFSKLPCHWQSCSYLANNQAGNQTVLNCQFRTWEAANVSIQQGHESGTAPPVTLDDLFFYLSTSLFVCLLGFFPGERGLQSLRKGPHSDSAVMGKWPRPSPSAHSGVLHLLQKHPHLLHSVRCGRRLSSRCC